MSHALLHAHDAFTLSFTKYKTRRIRTLLTLISTSVLALVLVVASSVLTGFFKIANTAPQTGLTDMHLAEVPTFNLNGSSTELSSDPNKDLQTFKDSNKTVAGIGDVYFEVSTNSQYPGAELANLKPEKSADEPGFFFGSGSVARSAALLQPFVASGQSLNWIKGQPLPVIVPTETVANAHRSELEKITDPDQRIKRRIALQNELIGKTTTLSLTGSNFSFSESGSPGIGKEDIQEQRTSKTLPVKIAGFSPTSAGLIRGYSINGYALPWEVVQQDPTAKALYDHASNFYPSFQTKKQRNAYVSASKGDAEIFADVVESNKRYFKAFNRVYNIGVIVMLVLMAIPMAATLSKILSDSQRETGVFRAIGARNRNILSIYGIYMLLLVVSAFVLSLIVGFTLAAMIDAKWSDDIALGIADIADTGVEVNLVRFNFEQLGTIFAGLLAGSTLGAAFPLFRSLRRDPIKALRDE